MAMMIINVEYSTDAQYRRIRKVMGGRRPSGAGIWVGTGKRDVDFDVSHVFLPKIRKELEKIRGVRIGWVTKCEEDE